MFKRGGEARSSRQAHNLKCRRFESCPRYQLDSAVFFMMGRRGQQQPRLNRARYGRSLLLLVPLKNSGRGYDPQPDMPIRYFSAVAGRYPQKARRAQPKPTES